MRAAIMGAGSLGIIIGALIKRKGYEIDLIDANPDNVAALNKNGATVTGFLEFNVPIKAYLPEQITGQYDLVFLLTKQTYNAAALPQLLPHLHADSTVCTLQNGIPEENVAAHVGKERTVGGAVGFGATWVAPGVSMLTTTTEVMEKFAFDIGEIDGAIRPRLDTIKQYLSSVGNCEILTNLMGVRWTKVLMNATFSGMSAALGCTFGDVLNDSRAMYALAHIADETIKVAHASGYRLVNMQGIDMNCLELTSPQDIPDKMPVYHKVWDPHAKLKASMLQDLEKGLPCEIDFINGYVCKKGREHKIATPFNDKVVELVKAAEAARAVPTFAANIGKFAAV